MTEKGRAATVGDQAARGEEAEQFEETRYLRRVGRSFGERPKDLHLSGTVGQSFFFATQTVSGKVGRLAVEVEGGFVHIHRVEQEQLGLRGGAVSTRHYATW